MDEIDFFGIKIGKDEKKTRTSVESKYKIPISEIMEKCELNNLTPIYVFYNIKEKTLEITAKEKQE